MKLIIICGRSNSGKTTLANEIAKFFDIKRISSSDYTKSLINENSREALENKFNELVINKGFDFISKKIIVFGDFKNNIGIIDGPRHIDLIKGFEKEIGKDNCLTIGISISQLNRFKLAKKANRIESSSLENYCNYEENSTHELYADKAVEYCNIIIGNEIIYNKDINLKKITDYINKWLK